MRIAGTDRWITLVAACAALVGSTPAAAEPATRGAWDTAVTTRAQKRPKSAATQQPPAATPVAPEAGIDAQPPAQAGQGILFADWHLNCAATSSKQSCALSQTVRDAHNRRIIQLTALRAGATAYLEVLVPVGISIPHGVTLNLADNIVLQAQLVDCNTVGCRAVLGLDGDTLKRLKAATALSVSFQDSKSGKIITIGGSPKGFEPGIAMLLAAP